MKKTITVLLVLAVLLSAFAPAVLAADTGKYRVISPVANVYSAADITSDRLCEIYADAVYEVSRVQRGFGQITVKAAGITGWVQLSHLVYLGEKPTGSVTGIRVIPPDKTEYVHETESIDLSGLKVYAVYEDGMQVTVTGYEVYADDMSSLGKKEVRVTYTPKGSGKTFTDSFPVTVVRYPVARLTVISRPARTMYLEHEPLDLSGLTVKLTYTDGRPEQMYAWEDIAADSHFTVSGCCGEAHGKRLEKGAHTVTLTYRYEDIAASFPITVTPRTLTSLTVVRQPDSLVTHHRDRNPDISGLLLKAEYDNGEVEEIPAGDCDVICQPEKFILGENNPVEVAYGGKTVQLFYKLSLNNVTGIKAVPGKLSFTVGQTIDPELKVQLTYADGTYEYITDYQMSEIDPEKEGSQNVIVTYGEYSDVFTISITTNHRLGDFNGDGEVTPEDARLTLRAAVGIIRMAQVTFNAVDVDKDNEVTPADARIILRASVGLEKL